MPLKANSSLAPEVPIDDLICRAVVAFVLLNLRCGYSREALSRLYALTLQTIATNVGSDGQGSTVDLDDAAHVLTLWRGLKEYVHKGKPRPLPLKGPGPSIEALAKRVNPQLRLSRVITQLTSSNAIKKVGRRFVVIRPWVSHRGTQQQSAHQLRTTLAFLGSQDHNFPPQSGGTSWFNRLAECPNFPRSKLPALDEYVETQVGDVIDDVDLYMLQLASGAELAAPRVRVGVGGFRFQDELGEQSPEYEDALRRIQEHLGLSASRTRNTTASTGMSRRRATKR